MRYYIRKRQWHEFNRIDIKQWLMIIITTAASFKYCWPSVIEEIKRK